MAGMVQQCCISCPSLGDSSIARENPAMLDKGDSANKLKERLSNAFDAWVKAAPAERRTKAEFARRCAALAERACTPQTVGGWFSTGRMDKLWLPVVEQVLGTTLGFGSSPPAQSDGPRWPFKSVTPGQWDSLPTEVHKMAESVLVSALESRR
jgi:hypothetical protein